MESICGAGGGLGKDVRWNQTDHLSQPKHLKGRKQNLCLWHMYILYITYLYFNLAEKCTFWTQCHNAQFWQRRQACRRGQNFESKLLLCQKISWFDIRGIQKLLTMTQALEETWSCHKQYWRSCYGQVLRPWENGMIGCVLLNGPLEGGNGRIHTCEGAKWGSP